MPSDSAAVTDRIARAFVACTLPKGEWTHEAHLRVGLWHRLRMSPEATLAMLRERIRRYNVATGGVNTDTDGYHETITRLYVILIDRWVAAADRGRAVDDLATEMIAQIGHREVPLRHYSRDRLFSVRARREWVEPDLEPLTKGPLA